MRRPDSAPGEIAARRGHLVAQTGKLILEIDIGGLDAARRQLRIGGVIGVENVADIGKGHGDRGYPRGTH